ncbi:unnamed protein product [Echinostoma caproni]|uniref:Amine oxidase domain-containing protein n=1 Tax=Echinostoma caproni TaxID=27848 RepID=A0A3P8FCV4_9TREM|nr:unnamed protein product [Echinostoma caproni]
MTAAKILSKEGLKTLVLEARDRNGGRIHTIRLPASNEGGEVTIDLGASYLHGCVSSQEIQPLFTLASRLNMVTTIAPGDVLGPHRGWECPEIAVWRDHKTGQSVHLDEVAEMSCLLDRCLVHILMTARQKKGVFSTKRTLADILDSSLDACLRLLFKAGQRTSPTLSRRERGIFDSLFARYIAYVNPAHRLPVNLSLGPHYEADAAANLAFDAEQPTAQAKQLYLNWLEQKRTHLAVHGPRCTVARRTEHRWEDRLVLQGFDQMIQFLATDLDIQHRCIVKHIDWSRVLTSRTQCAPTKWSNTNVNPDDVICVEASSYQDDAHVSASSRKPPQKYLARFCIITLPVGVLKGLDRRSAVNFHPALPARKQLAIDRLGVPRYGAETHNKIRLLNRPDHAIVQELMDLLSGMFPEGCPLPEPVFTTVTRWSEDPFSLGAYTAGEVGSDDDDRHAYASPLPSSDYPRVLFAGEGTVDSTGGQQCTHGAFTSGVNSALDILDFVQGGRCRLRDVRIVDYLTGYRTYNYPPHGMVRRAMKRKNDGSGLSKTTGKETESVGLKTELKRNNLEVSNTPWNEENKTLGNFVLTDPSSDRHTAGTNSNSVIDPILFPHRRSARLSTWISTQASASLHSFYKVRRPSHSRGKRSRTNTYCPSSSTSSVGSLKDELTPSPSSPEPSSDGAADDDPRVPGKPLTQSMSHLCSSAMDLSPDAPAITISGFTSTASDPTTSDTFDTATVFRSPLPLVFTTVSNVSEKSHENPIKPDDSDPIPNTKLSTSSYVPTFKSNFSSGSEMKDCDVVSPMGSVNRSERPSQPNNNEYQTRDCS